MIGHGAGAGQILSGNPNILPVRIDRIVAQVRKNAESLCATARRLGQGLKRLAFMAHDTPGMFMASKADGVSQGGGAIAVLSAPPSRGHGDSPSAD